MNDLYYVFPDIHGEYDLLRRALDYVERANPDGGKIIFLGDYIDRGPKNREVIETVMNPPENWEYITLLGNHEDLFLTAFYDGNRYALYDAAVLDEFGGEFEMVPNEVISWMKSLKLFHIEDDKNIFAHAFYNVRQRPENQRKNDCIWTRLDDWMSFDDGYHLTHGHTPRKHGPISTPNRTNLDAGAVFYGKFVIGIYEKGKLGPIGFKEFSK